LTSVAARKHERAEPRVAARESVRARLVISAALTARTAIAVPADNDRDRNARLNIDQCSIDRRASASTTTAAIVSDVPLWLISSAASATATAAAADTAHEYRRHACGREPLTVLDGILEHIEAARRSDLFFVIGKLAANGVRCFGWGLYVSKFLLLHGWRSSLRRIWALG
jgi:hypothetical protein